MVAEWWIGMDNANEKKSEETSSITNENEIEKKKKEKSKDSKIKTYIISIVIGIVTGFATEVITFFALSSLQKVQDVFSLPEQVNSIQTYVDSIDEKLIEINGNIKTNKEDFDKQIFQIRERLVRLETFHDIYISQIEPTKELGDYLIETFSVRSPQKASATIPQTIKLGVNDETNETCNPIDFVGKQMFVPYKNNGQYVLFYGQFNKNYHWDKNCILNIYEDNKLIFIMDAQYDDGQLKSYKQAFSDTTNQNEDVWVVSERVSEEKYNSGETWYYIREEDYKQSFDFQNVISDDLMQFSDFESILNTRIERYYKGDTFNGLFNDDSGDAQLVIYNSEGNVRYLYVGSFLDGYPYDDTGNAWSLGLDGDKYYYYKGKFDGERSSTPYPWLPATQEEIDQYVSQEKFNCSLKGLIDERMQQ